MTESALTPTNSGESKSRGWLKAEAEIQERRGKGSALEVLKSMALAMYGTESSTM